MTYSYDLSNAVGRVRLKIGDKSTSTAHFTDEELTYFLATNDNSVNLAAADALEAWAADLSDSAETEKIGDYSYTKKQVSNKLELAAKLREQDSMTPVLEWAEMDLEHLGDGEL